MKVYKCDNEKCEKETDCVKERWLTIGSSNKNGLFITNRLPGYYKATANYHDLHFCSKPCFIDYIVPPKDED